jgi:hypothetical protein
MRKLFIGSLVTVTLLASLAAYVQSDTADAQIQATLDKRIPEVKLSNVPFGDAIQYLRDVSGANIFVKTHALHDAGIDLNQPVSVHLKNAKVSKTLNLILQDVGGGNVKVEYTIDNDGVIVISTAEDLDRIFVMRVYDVSDIVDRDGNPVPAHGDPKASHASGMELVQCVVETIGDNQDRVPIATRPSERDGRSVLLLGANLVVVDTSSRQHEVRALLSDLRRLRDPTTRPATQP